MAMVQMLRLGMDWHRTALLHGGLETAHRLRCFLVPLVERKQNKTAPRQRCVNDEYRNPDCFLVSECAMGSLALMIWIYTSIRKETAREIYVLKHPVKLCGAMDLGQGWENSERS